MVLKDFVAFDFETMTSEQTSACALGLVKVKEGVIIEEYYTLIRPIPDHCEKTNSDIHGITPEMVEDAPTFEELFPFILNFIGGRTLVCHNAGTDINVLRRCMEYYHLSGIDLFRYVDTLSIYHVSLDKACAEKGIPFINHHNALADAEACARIYIASESVINMSLATGNMKTAMANLAGRKVEKAVLVPLEAEEVENKETPFFQQRVVITGVFEAYPNRNDLAKTLQNLGADINTSISKKTNIVVIGQGAGPSKLAKVESLRVDGYDIRVMYEAELAEILEALE